MRQIDTMDENGVDTEALDPHDFDAVVLHHQRQIYRTVLFLVRDADAAENLTQECFLRAYKNRNSFRQESNLSTWLMRIAINLAHDHNKNRRGVFWRRLRRMDKIDALHVSGAQQSPEQVLIDADAVNSIHAAVQTLPERQRIIFFMRYIEDMRLGMIAEALGLELGTVKTHLYRATETIRKACGRN